MGLNPSELKRYSRQTLIPEVGIEGQKRIKKASVIIVGLGGLGSPAALYLAAAGVGRLGLIDDDRVDISNLQRQILYSSAEAGQSKADCAAQKLRQLNPEIAVEAFNERLTAGNALKHFANYDYVLDGADNFATRYLTNDAAFFAGKPLVSASVLGFEGQLSVFAGDAACYRCLYPEPPPTGSVPSCAEAGVLGVMPGLLGVLQAAEVLKLILSLGEPLKSKLLLVQGLDSQFIRMELAKNPDCPLCGLRPKITELQEEHFVCTAEREIQQVSAGELREWLGKKTLQILDVREAEEFSEGKLEFTHHIPLADLDRDYTKLALETPVVVYCRSGGRSQHACEFLRQKGYNPINLRGGIRAWAAPRG